MPVDEEYAEEYDDEGAQQPKVLSARPAQSATGSARSSASRLTFPDLGGVELPRVALRPPVVVVAREDETTVTIARSSRGVVALQERNAEPTPAQQALRDFSSLHPVPVKKWHKGYLNEIAFATSAKVKAEEKRAATLAKFRAERLALLRTHFRPKAKGEDGEAVDSAKSLEEFFARQVSMARRQQESRLEGAEASLFEHASKKACTSCGGAQSFAEWRAGVKRCTKAECKGALFQPLAVWGKVQASFLGRWKSFIKAKEEHLAELDKELMPPFRVTTRTKFDRATGSMVEEAIEVPVWDDVAEDFFARQDEVIERLKAREAEMEARKNDKTSLVQRIKTKPYKFSKPLPPFFERQAAAAARSSLTFEERLAQYGGTRNGSE